MVKVFPKIFLRSGHILAGILVVFLRIQSPRPSFFSSLKNPHNVQKLLRLP